MNAGDKSILIVQNHGGLRRALRHWLEATFTGCRTVEAISGEEALVIAQTTSPHLIIVDISLPGMNGLETTVQLQSILPAVPVIILTDYEPEMQKFYVPVGGASAYVSKVQIKELESILAGLLSL